MIFTVYNPLSEGKPDFPSNLVTAFSTAESYEYCRKWQDIGEFSLTIPIDTEGIEKIREDMILIVEDEYNSDSLVITSIVDNGQKVVLKGYDLKIMLKWRVTLFPDEEIDKGTYGFDVSQGNTGQVIQHFIERNLTNPTDSRRKIFGLIAENLGGGISNDTYMSRMEPLNEVVQKLCKNADIGYDIVAGGSGYHLVIQEGTDKTNGKSLFGKVVFADYTMDADCITVETNTADRGNIVWAVNGGDADSATVIAVDNSRTDSNGNVVNPEETEGFNRREIVTTTNCDIDEIQIYAQKAAEDKFNKTTITFELKDYTIFINRFNVGDIVTVIKSGKEYNMRVLSATKSYSGNGKTIKVGIGDIPERKPLNKLYYNTYENRQGIIDEKLKDIDEATKPTPTPPPISSTAMVTFEKNRLYYNGETYHLQFGANKRIMCVTKGNKYALINSYGYTESRIEAATAVMNGLTEDWDLEFDCDDPKINVQSLLNGNYSGGDERKYENGRVKIRLTGSIPDVAGINFNWFECKREKGNLIHIGGRLSKVNVLCNRYKAEHITFGENIKVIGGVFFDKPSTIENGHEHGIPPFIENISGFVYSGSGYLYIPESCTNIARNTFAYNSASEIEIEEEGGMLTVGEGAFRKSDYGNAQLTVDVVKIPLRVSSSLYSNFAYLGARAIIFGKGITSLKYENIDYIVGDYFPLIKDIPCYIFIPSSVTSIGSNLIYYEPTKYRNTFIIYEGSQSSWNNITKSENWGGGNSNVTVICDSSAYNNSESFINRFVRRS